MKNTAHAITKIYVPIVNSAERVASRGPASRVKCDAGPDRGTTLEATWKDTGELYSMTKEALGISNTDAAKGVGIARSTLRQFEQGYPIQRATLVARSYRSFLELRALKIPVDDLNESKLKMTRKVIFIELQEFLKVEHRLDREVAELDNHFRNLPEYEWQELYWRYAVDFEGFTIRYREARVILRILRVALDRMNDTRVSSLKRIR